MRGEIAMTETAVISEHQRLPFVRFQFAKTVA